MYGFFYQGQNTRDKCKEFYIVVETECSSKIRFLEHKRPSSTSSEVSNHCHTISPRPGHHVDLDEAKKLDRKPRWFERDVKEAIYVKVKHIIDHGLRKTKDWLKIPKNRKYFVLRSKVFSFKSFYTNTDEVFERIINYFRYSWCRFTDHGSSLIFHVYYFHLQTAAALY